jgi:hypothetical protein
VASALIYVVDLVPDRLEFFLLIPIPPRGSRYRSL